VPFPSNKDPGRLFIAVSIPEHIKSVLFEMQEQYRALTDQFTFTHRSNLHLTLVFLGNTSASRMDRLQDIVRAVAKSVDPFSISTSDHGAFPKLENARVLFQQVSGSGPGLLALQRELSLTLESEFAFEFDDRDYHPHITLARIKKKCRGANITTWKVKNPPTVSFDVNAITLFESRLTKGTLTYLPVEQFRLK